MPCYFCGHWIVRGWDTRWVLRDNRWQRTHLLCLHVSKLTEAVMYFIATVMDTELIEAHYMLAVNNVRRLEAFLRGLTNIVEGDGPDDIDVENFLQPEHEP